ncbi:hypothetical protein ACN28C_03210 [Plantactinospora sp. WMMC1484]|uniref:hypothetical protein n=1 Tax=Plantactinospora sp. WMMC1484 TaxID=3404122 RepID=UPI003BF5AFA5
MNRAGEMAREMERVNRALEVARVHVAGLDQADNARAMRAQIANSPLRTLLEQAEVAAEAVTRYLREESSRP